MLFYERGHEVKIPFYLHVVPMVPYPVYGLLPWLFGFLRSGEFTCTPGNSQPLLVSDIAVHALDNQTVVRVHIWRAKVDPFG